MLLFAPLLGFMPNATLAAVVIVYSVRLIQPAEFAAIRAVRRMGSAGRSRHSWECWCSALERNRRGDRRVVDQLPAGPRILRCTRSAANGANVMRPVSPEHPNDETFPGP
jgi:hypothetical protein